MQKIYLEIQIINEKIAFKNIELNIALNKKELDKIELKYICKDLERLQHQKQDIKRAYHL